MKTPEKVCSSAWISKLMHIFTSQVSYKLRFPMGDFVVGAKVKTNKRFPHHHLSPSNIVVNNLILLQTGQKHLLRKASLINTSMLFLWIFLKRQHFKNRCKMDLEGLWVLVMSNVHPPICTTLSGCATNLHNWKGKGYVCFEWKTFSEWLLHKRLYHHKSSGCSLYRNWRGCPEFRTDIMGSMWELFPAPC